MPETTVVGPLGMSARPVAVTVDISGVLASLSLLIREEVVSVRVCTVSGNARTTVETRVCLMVTWETCDDVPLLVSGPAGTEEYASCPGLVGSRVVVAVSEDRWTL